MILHEPTTAPRIVPYQQDRLATDVMRNGHPALRVTQRFSASHDGIDIANFWCGDILLASLAGTVNNRIDSRGALIAEIYQDDGSGCGYGHLKAFGRPDGASVGIGEVIGYLGSTGLSTSCHCHYSAWNRDHLTIDPWPLLEQNQVIPDTAVEDMYEWIPAISHQIPKLAVISGGTRLLKNPNGALHYKLPADTRVEIIAGLISGRHYWVGRRAPSGGGLFLIPDEAVESWLKG